MNVRNFKSEIGVLYLNDFNEQVLMKIIREKGLEFEELFACDTYVYLWSGHPLAGQSVISMEELDEYRACPLTRDGTARSTSRKR